MTAAKICLLVSFLLLVLAAPTLAESTCRTILSFENLLASLNEDHNPNPIDNYALVAEGQDEYGHYFAMEWCSPKHVDLTIRIPDLSALGSRQLALTLAANAAVEIEVWAVTDSRSCDQSGSHLFVTELLHVDEAPKEFSLDREAFHHLPSSNCQGVMTQDEFDQLTALILFAPAGKRTLRIYSMEFPGAVDWFASTQPQDMAEHWLNDLNVFVGQTSDSSLLDLSPTVMGWANNYVPGYQCELISWAKHHGMRFISSLSFWEDNITTAVANLPPELQDATCIDIDGDVFMRPQPDQELVWMSTAAPAWRDKIRDFAYAEIDRGVDGFVLDEFMGNIATMHSGGTFDEHSLQGFREFLQAEYSAATLQTEFGIDDIATFDYRMYLLDRGLRERYLVTPWECPLFDDYYRFQEEDAIRFAQQVVEDIREYGTAQGKDLVISANAYEMGIANLWTAAISDYLTFEHQYLWPEGVELSESPTLPPQWRAVPQLKLANAITSHRPVAMLSIPDFFMLGELNPDTAYDLLNLFIAEAYAANGTFLHFNIDAFEASPERISPTFDLFREYADILRDSDSLAKVGVLYSHPTVSQLGDFGFRGACLMLSDLVVQYDVLFAGFGAEIDDYYTLDHDITTDQLQQYEVLVLPGSALLTDHQVALILDYLETGGRIIAWDGDGNQPGSLDPWEEPTYRPRLHALLIPGTYSVGAGTLTYLRDHDLGRDYYTNYSVDTLDLFGRLLLDHIDPLVRFDDPTGLNAYVAWNANRRSVVVSIINADLDPSTGRIHDRKDLAMTVELPLLFDATSARVTFSSPGSEVQELSVIFEAVSEERCVSFTIPRLSICGLVILEEISQE